MTEAASEAVCVDCGVLERFEGKSQAHVTKRAARRAGEHYQECGKKTYVNRLGVV